MIRISESITLEKLLPLIQKLPKVERDQLRKSLEAEAQLMPQSCYTKKAK